MKRSGFPAPTKEQIQRAREKRDVSARRYQEKLRQAPKPTDVSRSRRRRKRMPRENRERRAKLRAIQFGPPGFVEWVHSLGCSVPSCNREEIEAAHAKGRGAGGTWEDILPLCDHHHGLQHTRGVKCFERYVGFSLADVANVVHRRWLAFAGTPEEE